MPKHSSPLTHTEACLCVGSGQAILKSCKINSKECQDIQILRRVLGNKRVSPFTRRRQSTWNFWEKQEFKAPSFPPQLFMQQAAHIVSEGCLGCQSSLRARAVSSDYRLQLGPFSKDLGGWISSSQSSEESRTPLPQEVSCLRSPIFKVNYALQLDKCNEIRMIFFS